MTEEESGVKTGMREVKQHTSKRILVNAFGFTSDTITLNAIIHFKQSAAAFTIKPTFITIDSPDLVIYPH